MSWVTYISLGRLGYASVAYGTQIPAASLSQEPFVLHATGPPGSAESLVCITLLAAAWKAAASVGPTASLGGEEGRGPG